MVRGIFFKSFFKEIKLWSQNASNPLSPSLSSAFLASPPASSSPNSLFFLLFYIWLRKRGITKSTIVPIFLLKEKNQAQQRKASILFSPFHLPVFSFSSPPSPSELTSPNYLDYFTSSKGILSHPGGTGYKNHRFVRRWRWKKAYLGGQKLNRISGAYDSCIPPLMKSVTVPNHPPQVGARRAQWPDDLKSAQWPSKTSQIYANSNAGWIFLVTSFIARSSRLISIKKSTLYQNCGIKQDIVKLIYVGANWPFVQNSSHLDLPPSPTILQLIPYMKMAVKKLINPDFFEEFLRHYLLRVIQKGHSLSMKRSLSRRTPTSGRLVTANYVFEAK